MRGPNGYLDGVEISREAFCQRLPDEDPPPTAAAPGVAAFRATYEELGRAAATQILSIHISTSLSATGDVARLAAQQTQSVPVTVLDSRQLSLGTGLLVEAAARAAAQGHTLDEILLLLEDQIVRTHVFAALDTLEYLRRSGRMNGAVARFGELLRIKPLLRMHDGDPTTERVRTNNGAFKRMIDILQELAPFEKVALVHTHAADKAEALLSEAAHLLPEEKLHSVDITPVLGANIGPGAVGFAVVSARRD